MRESELRSAICAAGRRLGSRGLVAASEGNLSVRLDEVRLLVTPSGRRKDELAPDDLAVVALDPATGPPPEGPPPSSDVRIHRAVYAARRDVTAIVHAHVPAAMALSLAGEVPDPAALPETAHVIPVLPHVAFAPMGSDELASSVAAAMDPVVGPRPGAVLLERHGALAVGETAAGNAGAALIQAVDRLELVDVLCRAWRDAILVRGALGRPGGVR